MIRDTYCLLVLQVKTDGQERMLKFQMVDSFLVMPIASFKSKKLLVID
jgi:hypothetical protein